MLRVNQILRVQSIDKLKYQRSFELTSRYFMGSLINSEFDRSSLRIGNKNPSSKFGMANKRYLSNDSEKGNTEPKKNKLATVVKHSVGLSKSILVLGWQGLKTVADVGFDIIRHPTSIPEKFQMLWVMTKDTVHHYWVGTKLLWTEMKMTSQILNRLLKGHGMTRRERIQLIRTTTDMFRLVPFAVFVIVPFMELLLPVALKLFPNMLPSTFQDKLKREEMMKQELQMRLAIAGFMQETLHAMADKKKKEADSKDAASAKEVIDFMTKAREGEALSNDQVIRMAQLFKDELTLANIARPQLVTMCQFMKLQPYGTDALLRFQLRTKLRAIKEDDRRILWEGLDSLTKLELREACRERGMRSVGLSMLGYRHQLQEWLNLSIQKNIPISLLVMSRAFLLSSTTSGDILRDSLSSLDEGLVNEVVLQAAQKHEEGTVEMRKRKLDSLEFQKDLIQEELEEVKKTAEKKDKKAKEKEKEKLDSSAKDKDKDKDKDNRPPLPGSIPRDETADAAGKDSQCSTTISSAKTASTELPILEPDSAAVNVNAAVEDKDSGISDAMTLAEIRAIGDMALSSAVEREKVELALLKTRGLDWEGDVLVEVKGKTHLIPLGTALAASKGKTEVKPIGKPDSLSTSVATSAAPSVAARDLPSSSDSASEPSPLSDDDAIDHSVVNLKKALKSMLTKLEVRIETTEKALGARLQRLDLDGDGILDANELKEAVVGVLKRYSSQDSADELVRMLDKDKDGQVSVSELLEFVQSHHSDKVT